MLSIFVFANNNASTDLNEKTNQWLKNQPVKFTENKGQLTDMKKNPVPFVLFKANVPSVDLYITEKGLTYVFIEHKKENDDKEKNEAEKIKYDWARVDMILKNASIKKENIIKEEESKNVSHYYIGDKVIRDVHEYNKITIKEIYPGIDWLLYNTNNNGFKYDFILHQNADVSQIKLIYEGAGKFIGEKNQIQFKNKIGELLEGKLFCYQGNEANEVESKYIIRKNQDSRLKTQDKDSQQPISNNKQQFSYEVSIQLSEYNHSKKLIIDPQVTWATYIGGNGSDGPLSITNDPNNDILITGYQGSTDLPVLDPGSGAFYQGSYVGIINTAFIMKFDNNGVLFWSTYLTGDRGATASTITSDLLGNSIVVGSTTSTNFPTFNPGGGAYYQGTRTDSVDAFIMKFSPTGVLTWGTYYGGDSVDVAYAVRIDATNNIYVGGHTKSLNFPVQNSGGFYQGTNQGGVDGFVLKFNANGIRQHATYFGGSTDDIINALCLDATGNLFLTGQTDSPNFPTLNPGGGAYFQPTSAGTTDIFVAKLNNALALNWSTYYGGAAMDIATSITSDISGNIFIGGFTVSPTLPLLNPGGGAYFQGANAGGQDAVILKFTNAGIHSWSTFYGGTGMDYFKSPFNNITVDLCNNIILSFATMSPDIPTQASCDNGYNPLTLKGPADCFVLKFTNNGNRLWAIYMGGDGFDFRESNCVDKLGNFFMTGEWHQPTNQTTYPVITPGAGAFYDGTHNSGDDGYIIKFSPTNVSLTANSTNAGCNCTGTATATPTGGCAPYQYLWYNSSWTQIGNSQTINNLCPGTYQVIVRDSMMCSLPDTANVNITGGGAPILLSQNPIICVGANYTLPDGSIVTTAGTYIDTIVSGNGCDTIITTNLSTTNTLTTSQNPVICAGQNFTLPGGSSATINGTYIDTLIAINGGCDSIVTTILTVIPAATFSQSINICTGANYILPGGDTVNIAGIYSDTLSTIAGCDSIVTTTLTLLPSLTSSQNISLCNGQSFTLPSGTVVSTAGTYLDTLTAQGGCDSIITTSISVKPNSSNTLSHNMCSGNSYTLPGGTIVTTSGTYIDTLTSSNGCDSVITTTITVYPTPIINVSSNITILSGQSTTLTATGGGTYIWTPNSGLDSTTTSTVIATPSSTTTYCVEVTSTNGCKDTACVTVTVEIPCPSNENLQVPNAFSPNTDNINDEFCLQGWEVCLEDFTIHIFDRWGEKVFESKDPNFCWDGTFRNNLMDAQVLVYYLKARFTNIEKPVIKKGNVTLIR